MAEVSTPGILNCYENRPFWISWRDGALRVGEGENGGRMFMDYPWQEYRVYDIGLSSDTTEGEWDTELEEGNNKDRIPKISHITV